MTECFPYRPKKRYSTAYACLEEIRAVVLPCNRAEFDTVSVNEFLVGSADGDSAFECEMSVGVSWFFAAHSLADDLDVGVIDDGVDVMDDSGNVLTNVENVFHVNIVAESFPDFGLIV